MSFKQDLTSPGPFLSPGIAPPVAPETRVRSMTFSPVSAPGPCVEALPSAMGGAWLTLLLPLNA